MKAYLLTLVITAVISVTAFGQKKIQGAKKAQDTRSIEQKVEDLMKQMTLDEKVGQLNQYNGDWNATGPITVLGNKLEDLKAGKIGSMLNITGVKHTKELQQVAMQSRLKIPLLFGQDVIHGYRVTFPIPLAEAASWDTAAIERQPGLQLPKQQQQVYTGRLHLWWI